MLLGPLIWEKDGRSIVMGIASWGLDCGQDEKPAVFGKVSKALDWISDQGVITNENKCWPSENIHWRSSVN